MSITRKVGVATVTAGLVLSLLPGAVAAQGEVSVDVSAQQNTTVLEEGGGEFFAAGSFAWTPDSGEYLYVTWSSDPDPLPALPSAVRRSRTNVNGLTGPVLTSPSQGYCETSPCSWEFRYPALDDVVATITITATVGLSNGNNGTGVRPRALGDSASDSFTITVTNGDPDKDKQTQFYAVQDGLESWGQSFYLAEGPYTLILQMVHDPGPLDTLRAKFDCGDGVWRDGVAVDLAPDDWRRFMFRGECPGDADGGYGIPGSPVGEAQVRARICDDDSTTCADIDLPANPARHQCLAGAGVKCQQEDPVQGDGKRTITKPVTIWNTPPTADFRAPQNAAEGVPFTLTIENVVDVPADLPPTFEFDCDVQPGDAPIPFQRWKDLTRAQRARVVEAAVDDRWLPADQVSADGTSATKTCVFPNGPETHWVMGRIQDKDMAALDSFDGLVGAIPRNGDQVVCGYRPDLQTIAPRQIGDFGCWVYLPPRLVHVTNQPATVQEPVVTIPAAKITATSVLAKVSAAFTDPGSADTHTCVIDWGDGTVVPGTVTEANGAGTCTGQHTFTTGGRFTVAVTISDLDGASRTASTVYVVPEPTNAKPVVAKPTFTGAGAATTPMSATFTDANTTDTHLCDITWGDGTGESGGVVEINGAGTCSASHTFPGPGTYPVEVTVTDQLGASRSASANYVVPTPGGPTPVYQPDAQVRRGKANQPYLGNGVYSTAATGEIISATIARGTSRGFIVKVQNDGTALDTIRVWGFGRGHGIRVTYYQGKSGTVDITPQVTAGTYEFTDLQPGESAYLRMVIRPNPGAVAGATRGFKVTTTSQSDASKKDAIKVIATAS